MVAVRLDQACAAAYLPPQRPGSPPCPRLEGLAWRDFTPFAKKALWRGADLEQLLEWYRAAVMTLRTKHSNPYMLRHIGISWKLQDGVPIFVVSRDAKHESVNTTDRHYGHNDRKASKSAAQIIAGRSPRVRASMLALTA